VTDPLAGRAPLSRDRILDEAAALASDPAASFSMRRLAERLGVTPMALYKWFDNRDDLLRALMERVGARTPATVPGDGPWLDRALRFTIAIRANLLEYLPLLRIAGAARRLEANVFREADEGLRLMREAGYEGQAAVDAYRAMFWAVFNFCMVIDAGGTTPGSGIDALLHRAVPLDDAELAAAMPTLAALLPHFGPVDHDAFFALSMRALLSGLELGGVS
jgi:AcrR family transcriptional regulator